MKRESPRPRWREPRHQVAALPYRFPSEGGGLEVMLVTSRETRRWVIPKGWPIRGLKAHAAAAQEAFEEAGLVGRVAKRALGSYPYGKRLKHGSTVPCLVEVFPFEVREQRKRWPEKAQRDGRWFTPIEAAAAVDEAELGRLILALEAHVAAQDGQAGATAAAPGRSPHAPG